MNNSREHQLLINSIHRNLQSIRYCFGLFCFLAICLIISGWITFTQLRFHRSDDILFQQGLRKGLILVFGGFLTIFVTITIVSIISCNQYKLLSRYSISARNLQNIRTIRLTMEGLPVTQCHTMPNHLAFQPSYPINDDPPKYSEVVGFS